MHKRVSGIMAIFANVSKGFFSTPPTSIHSTSTLYTPVCGHKSRRVGFLTHSAAATAFSVFLILSHSFSVDGCGAPRNFTACRP